MPNGCFLNGITRQRIIDLLRKAGIIVIEQVLTATDFAEVSYSFISPLLSPRIASPVISTRCHHFFELAALRLSSLLHQAEEIFTTGNVGKVQVMNQFEDRVLLEDARAPGPIAATAKAL